jgi:amidase
MSSNKTARPIAPPTEEELRTAAQAIFLETDRADLEFYAAAMAGLVDEFNALEAMDLPRLPVQYPRAQGYRPSGDENRYGAWQWKCQVKGAATGKLAGKHVVIKDNIGVAGMPMLNGSALYEGYVADEDATVVTRILDAGGEVLGKAVCENFCYSGGSHTAASGPVRNPRNPDFMTGGSSSGCAALIVAGECDMAVGSDQGGSVRMPSSWSGCVGIKPTHGLVPYTGAGPIEQSIDHLGPMAASSVDCALLLEVIAGYDDSRDPRQVASLQSKPYSELVTEGIHGLRIGIVGEGFGAPGSEADVDEAVALAARSLVKAGAVVEDISIPVHAEAMTVMFASSVDGTLSTWSDQGPAGPNPGGYHPLGAIRFFQEARKSRAADLPDMAKTVMLFAHVMRARYGNYYSAKAQNLLRPIRAAYDEALKNCDLLIMPTAVMKAHPIPPADASREEILGMTLDMLGNTAPFDGTNHPSMSVPVCLSDGLPVGMMITGRCGEDDVVLRAGHAFEMLRGPI